MWYAKELTPTMRCASGHSVAAAAMECRRPTRIQRRGQEAELSCVDEAALSVDRLAVSLPQSINPTEGGFPVNGITRACGEHDPNLGPAHALRRLQPGRKVTNGGP